MLWYVYESDEPSFIICESNRVNAIAAATCRAHDLSRYPQAAEMDWTVTEGCGDNKIVVWSYRSGYATCPACGCDQWMHYATCGELAGEVAELAAAGDQWALDYLAACAA